MRSNSGASSSIVSADSALAVASTSSRTPRALRPATIALSAA
jgi:hypothetical protein